MFKDKQIFSWAMYDWANSAFATTILSAILPIYFSKVLASDLSPQNATVYWSYTISIALLITALISPVIGAVSDYTNRKKLFLKICAGIGILFTGFLYFTKTGDWLMASFFFIIANSGYSLSLIFYDSLLGFIAKRDEIDRVSTFGYALGYLGGGLLLAVNLLMFSIFKDSSFAARLSFLSVAVWWAIFSIPLFINVPETKIFNKIENENYLKVGFKRVKTTFTDIRQYRDLFIFLIAFWIYNDGIGTIIKLAAIYGSELGISATSLIGALLVTQFVGIPFSIFFGTLSVHLGAKKCIYIGLLVYTLISIGAFFITNAYHFWILAIMVGTVQGGTQALSRSLFASMVPKSNSAEFFGFYGMSSKFAGIAGPLIFAVVNQMTGSSRLSIISLIIFFIAGIAMLTFVDEKEGGRIASLKG
ncbi:MAG: MFS transporter [Thermodesulfobacteriota bacterium]